jgi:hypothetical protein
MNGLEYLEQLLAGRGCVVDDRDEYNLSFTTRIAAYDRWCVIHFDGYSKASICVYIADDDFDKKQWRRLEMLVRYAALDAPFAGRMLRGQGGVLWEVGFFLCPQPEGIESIVDNVFQYLVDDISRLVVIMGLYGTSMGVREIRKMVEDVGLIQGQA